VSNTFLNFKFKASEKLTVKIMPMNKSVILEKTCAKFDKVKKFHLLNTDLKIVIQAI